MFRGATRVTLDAKGRMVIPTRYRERLAERGDARLVVTIDRDQCLLIYPLNDWEEIERKLMRLPTFNEHVRRLQELMVGHATDELAEMAAALPPTVARIRHLERTRSSVRASLRAVGRATLEERRERAEGEDRRRTAANWVRFVVSVRRRLSMRSRAGGTRARCSGCGTNRSRSGRAAT